MVVPQEEEPEIPTGGGITAATKGVEI